MASSIINSRGACSGGIYSGSACSGGAFSSGACLGSIKTPINTDLWRPLNEVPYKKKYEYNIINNSEKE
jgi:hypothetical protein